MQRVTEPPVYICAALLCAINFEGVLTSHSH